MKTKIAEAQEKFVAVLLTLNAEIKALRGRVTELEEQLGGRFEEMARQCVASNETTRLIEDAVEEALDGVDFSSVAERAVEEAVDCVDVEKMVEDEITRQKEELDVDGLAECVARRIQVTVKED